MQSPLIAAPRWLEIVKVFGLNIGKVKLVGIKSNIVKAKNYLRSSSRVRCTDSSLVPQPTCYWKSDGDHVYAVCGRRLMPERRTWSVLDLWANAGNVASVENIQAVGS